MCDKNLGPKMRLMLAGGGERAAHESSPPLRAARAAHTAVSPGSGAPVPRAAVKRPRSMPHAGEAGAKRTTPPPGVVAATPAPLTGPLGEPRPKAPRRPSPAGTAVALPSRPASAVAAAQRRAAPASPVPWRGFDSGSDGFASPPGVAAPRPRGRSAPGIEALAAAAGAWSSDGEGATPRPAYTFAATGGKENAVPGASPPLAPPAAKRVSGAGAVFSAHAFAAEEQRRLSAAYAAELARLRAYAALPPLPPGRDSARYAPSDPALAAMRRQPIGYVLPPPGARSSAGFPGIAPPMEPARPIGALQSDVLGCCGLGLSVAFPLTTGVSPAMSAGLARLRAAAVAHVAAAVKLPAPAPAAQAAVAV